jgi:hypothetical protein
MKRISIPGRTKLTIGIFAIKVQKMNVFEPYNGIFTPPNWWYKELRGH